MASSLLLLLGSFGVTMAIKKSDRSIRVINEAGFKVQVYWINRWDNDALVLNSEEGIFHGAESGINSYIDHEFEVHEMPGKRTGYCGGPDNSCRKGYFQVNDRDNQLIILKEGLESVEHHDDQTRAHEKAAEVMTKCKEAALEEFGDAENPEALLEAMMECAKRGEEETLTKQQEEVIFQNNLRYELGSKLMDYACLDPNVTMTEAIENKTWNFRKTVKNPSPVRVLLERSYATIHYIEQFISEDECQLVEAATAEHMKRVDGVNGLYAKKGGVDIDFADLDSPVTKIVNKVYRYARDSHLKRLSFDIENAEKLFSLHYEPGTGDRYESHCDGVCGTRLHKKGDRVATMIMYCEVPEKGGGTHFDKSGIHVVPQKGSALFYTYIDPDKQVTDPGFTSHGGCALAEGTKKILTHKIRY